MGHRGVNSINTETSTQDAARILAANILRTEFGYYREARELGRHARTDGRRRMIEVTERMTARALKRVNAALRLYHFAELDSRGALSTYDAQEEAYEAQRAAKSAQEATGAPDDSTALSDDFSERIAQKMGIPADVAEAYERVRKIPCRKI